MSYAAILVPFTTARNPNYSPAERFHSWVRRSFGIFAIFRLTRFA